MKKYKLFRTGRCYIKKTGEFVIALLGGCKKKYGYTFKVSHVCRHFYPDKIYLQSRIVPNDGTWIEIPPQEFAFAARLHEEGITPTVV